MDRTEFIHSLRRALSDIDDYEFTNETIKYYENYIDTQIRKGNSEHSVLRELGEPKYIAKSIKASRGINTGRVVDDDVYYEEEKKVDEKKTYNIRGHRFELPMWAAKILKFVAVCLGLALVVVVARVLLPVVIVGVIAVMLYRFIRDNFFGGS